MARRSTIDDLLESDGPFDARLVRPDMPVRVLRLVPSGVVVEAEIDDRGPREVICKVGGLRCPRPQRPSRSLADWVLAELRSVAPDGLTAWALAERAVAAGVATKGDALRRVGYALGWLGPWGVCEIYDDDTVREARWSGRRRQRRVWKARDVDD